MKLQDKVAIVTGGSQGIGKIYALELLKHGAKVIIADVNEEKGRVVEETLKKEGFKCSFVKVDVSSPDSTKTMAQFAVDTYGTIDILVNNAAIFSTLQMKPFEEISFDEWNLVMNVNLTGVFLCCQAVVPVMRKQKSGRIINISSDVIFSGKTDFLHYVATKAGIAGLSRALAREVGDDNITVNTVAPGPVFTESKRVTTTPEQDAVNLSKQCIKRHATPEDLVGIISFLSSGESAFISGQLFTVNGGKEMH